MTTITVWYIMYSAVYAAAQFGPFASIDQCEAAITQVQATSSRWSYGSLVCVEGVAVVSRHDHPHKEGR